jgi:Heavy metal associated domain 2
LDRVTILSIFSAIVAAVWTAWTWREEHKEVRRLQRDQAAALYVNPLLIAAHQMERQIDRLLDGRELILNKREPGDRDASVSGAAIEAVWTFAQLFAWAAVNLRYGPYARDPKVIELIVALSRTFDDRERFGDGAFRFSAAEQESLGHTVLRRVGHTSLEAGGSASALTEFAIVPAVDFERDFRDAQSPKAGLYGGRSVRTAVEAIDRAERVEQLGGRERLAAVKQLLKRLLNHLGHLEGLSVSLHKDQQVSLEEIVADALVNGPSTRILHRMKGRIRLVMAQVRANRGFADRLGALIRTWEGVEDVSINVMTGSVAIRYRTTQPDDEFQANIVAAIEKALQRKDADASTVVPRRRLQGASSWQPVARVAGTRPARRQRA